MSAPNQKKHVVVLGAGVIGLTTALVIQQSTDYQVTIIAEHFATDPKSIRYTSHWAGAHNVPAESKNDPKKAKLEQETFETMLELSDATIESERYFLRVPQTDYHESEDTNVDFLSFMPDFKHLAPSALAAVPTARAGIAFTTVNIDTPVYLPWLQGRFLANGGTTVRASVQHIAQVLEGGTQAASANPGFDRHVDALVVCVGLGARALGGVEDANVHPVRGQTVVVRAPWVRSGSSVVGKDGAAITYVIPRRCGQVILGGTRGVNDWYPVPRPETTTDILTRTLALCPELAPPAVRAKRTPTIDDLRPLIEEEGCGFRPGRTGGIRLETEWVDVQGRKVPVIHHYGHDGYGYQSSWGSAAVAVDLIKEAVNKN